MRIVQLALGEPWLIRPEAARSLLAIAERVEGLALEPMVERVEALNAKAGPRLPGSRSATLRAGGVAVVPVHGPIMRHAGMFDDVCGVTSLEGIDRDLEAALASPDVKSVVLHVDSPGGMAADIAEMADKIRAADAVKPVRAYVGNQCSSAAMWLASGAREVVASQTAMLGSIGVVLTATDTKAKDEREGVKEIEIISSVSPDKRPDPATDAGRAKLQSLVDRLGDEFVDGVARLRGVSRDHVLEKFGKGGQLVGRDAVAAGLADRIGSFDALLREVGANPGASGAPTTPRDPMPQDTNAPAAGETVAQIEARVRAELEASIRADAEKTMADARSLAIGAKVEGLVARLGGKATPAQLKAIEPLAKQLAADDFGDKGSRLQALEGVLAGLPEHGLTSEVVSSDRTHGNGGDPKPEADDAELDAETQAFLASTKKLKRS